MSDDNLDRRRFLKLAGAAAAGGAAIPAIPSLGWGEKSPPTRLVVFFSSNGTIKDRWRPNGSGSNFTIPSDGILTPLKPVKDKILVVDKITMESAQHGPGNAHMTGISHLLTGRKLRSGNRFSGGGNANSGWGNGISADQFIAQKTHDGERFKSLEFAVQAGGPNIRSRMSYSGPAQPVEPVQDPFKAFDSLFKPVVKKRAKLEKIRTRRKSVLDFVRDDLKRVKKRASGQDRKRIERHTTALRELERQMMTGNGMGVACKPPTKGSRFDPTDSKNFPETGRRFMDLIAAAFSCQLTRVATIQWDTATSGLVPSWLGISHGHHDMSHEDGRWEDELVELNRWYAKQFKYLIDKLDSMPEGNGTVLDNTILVWANDMGDGSTHTQNDVPFVIAGGGGYFKTGEFLEVERNHNDLLVSLCRAMGVNVNKYGDPAFCNGPMTELKA